MKVWLLDNGSIVIDHAQLMWNIGGGTPVRIPSYGVLIEHDEGLFLFDPWDEFVMEHLQTFDGKPLKLAEKAEVNLDGVSAFRLAGVKVVEVD